MLDKVFYFLGYLRRTRFQQESNEHYKEMKTLQTLVDSKSQEISTLREWLEKEQEEKNLLLKRLGIIPNTTPNIQSEFSSKSPAGRPILTTRSWNRSKRNLENYFGKDVINKEVEAIKSKVENAKNNSIKETV